jgi:hypothetical protein
MATNKRKTKSAVPPHDAELISHTNGRCRIVLTGSSGGGKTTAADLFRREIGVIFFESAAGGGMGIEGGNPVRNESMEQAAALDAKLRRLWEHHPRFVLVRHNPSFFRKISFGLAELDAMVTELAARQGRPSATAKGQHASH